MVRRDVVTAKRSESMCKNRIRGMQCRASHDDPLIPSLKRVRLPVKVEIANLLLHKIYVAVFLQKFEVAHEVELLWSHFQLGQANDLRQVPFAIAPVEG